MTARLLAALLAAAVATAPPMTNEDVVRLVTGGTPQREILDAIAQRPAAYDLSEEMVEELKLAGVPDGVLAAMRARQAPAPSPAEDKPLKGKVRLTVALTGPAKIEMPRKIPDAIAARLRLPADVREADDVAIFLACVTAEHVPDQWRSKTPLGRDVDGTPRHEMLLFVPGDTPAGAKPTLVLPSTLDVDVDDLEPHDLLFGIAARVGDRWRAASYVKRPRVAGGGSRLTGRIEAAGPFVFKVELDAAQSANDTSLETPASSIVTP